MIEVLKKDDGLWLSFKAPSGRSAMVRHQKLLTGNSLSIIDSVVLETLKEAAKLSANVKRAGRSAPNLRQ